MQFFRSAPRMSRTRTSVRVTGPSFTGLSRSLIPSGRHQLPAITRVNGFNRQGLERPIAADMHRRCHVEALIAVPTDELVQSIFVLWNGIAPFRFGRVAAGRPDLDAVFSVVHRLTCGDGCKPLSTR